MKKKTRFIVTSGVIAAAYAALSLISAALGLAYGPVQFRLSEALCVLAAFDPAAVCGLTVGCLISNIGSPLGAVDMLFGTAATLIASVVGRLVRRIRIHRFPWLTVLVCVIVNAVTVGIETAVMFASDEAFFATALLNTLWVAVGEAVVCFGGGIPLCAFISRSRTLREFL